MVINQLCKHLLCLFFIFYSWGRVTVTKLHVQTRLLSNSYRWDSVTYE